MSSTANQKLPIIYTSHYNISFLGLEKFHPFDSKKYGNVHQSLVEKNYFSTEQCYEPTKITDDELLEIHTPDYLEDLNIPTTIAQITELQFLSMLSNSMLQKHLLTPMRYGTAGTILSVKLATEQYGWSINLSGGYHHAKAHCGGGFCFFADIPLAIQQFLKKNPKARVLVLDLDAHQGNGYAEILADDPRVHIFDIYNKLIYPQDYDSHSAIDYNFPIDPSISEDDYLAILEANLPKAIHEVSPDLIIYNAGTDILKGDFVGGMQISGEGITYRDEFVFRTALKQKIPISMLLSGGYTKQSAFVIRESISNLFDKHILHDIQKKFQS
ncbi:MAG: histone deacetylase 11 [bacterium]|jgi:histone deacetylase 11